MSNRSALLYGVGFLSMLAALILGIEHFRNNTPDFIQEYRASRTHEKAQKDWIQEVNDAAKRTGEYPHTLTLSNDGWGNPGQIRGATESSYQTCSNGMNGIAGDDDDICATHDSAEVRDIASHTQGQMRMEEARSRRLQGLDPYSTEERAQQEAAQATRLSAHSLFRTVAEIERDYQDNEIRADQMYKGTRVAIQGDVSGVGRDVMGTPYVSLKSPDKFSGDPVTCYFAQEDSRLGGLRKGEHVLLVGQGRGTLLGVVGFNECVFYE